MSEPTNSPPQDGNLPSISVVVIGRNEGDRLVRCLESVRTCDYPAEKIELIYVDTDSTDDSCAVAEGLGAKVIRIRPKHPTAAAARNAGWREARHDLIHFLDGDTILDKAWLRKAVAAIESPGLAAVYGKREEMQPGANIYHFWMQHDWYVPPGRVESCGGDVLFRRGALVQAGGYDEMLIAGEERDLCTRLIRDQDAGILRLNEPMTLHDINMTRFPQYWKRCLRAGYAYAQVAARYPGLRHWRRTCRRNLMHALLFLLAVTLSVGLRSIWPVTLWAGLLAVAVIRDARRCRARVGSLGGALLYAVHHYLSKIPTLAGHMKYYREHFFGSSPQGLIEYDASARA